jgi:hypothetical protein
MNTLIIAQLIMQGLQNLQKYQQLLLTAQADGNRDVTDAEIDGLGELGKTIRSAARAEADRQRVEAQS